MTRAIFDKMYDANPNNKSDFLKAGSGLAVILECLKKSNDEDGEYFVCRMKVLEAKAKDSRPCNNPGDIVGWVQMFGRFPRTAYSNVQGLVLAIVGAKKEEVSKEAFTATFEDMINYQKGTKSEASGRSIDEVQAARGMLIRFDSYDQQTKAQKAAKSSETNTYNKFFHVAEQGDIEARRAELDKTDPIQG